MLRAIVFVGALCCTLQSAAAATVSLYFKSDKLWDVASSPVPLVTGYLSLQFDETSQAAQVNLPLAEFSLNVLGDAVDPSIVLAYVYRPNFPTNPRPFGVVIGATPGTIFDILAGEPLDFLFTFLLNADGEFDPLAPPRMHIAYKDGSRDPLSRMMEFSAEPFVTPLPPTALLFVSGLALLWPIMRYTKSGVGTGSPVSKSMLSTQSEGSMPG